MAKSFVPKLLPNKVIAKDNEHRLDELQSKEVCNIVTSPFSHNNMLVHTPPWARHNNCILLKKHTVLRISTSILT